MNAKELNEKLNNLIKENEYAKGEYSFWETREIVKNLTEKVLSEIPNTEFFVRSGYRCYDDNKSKNNLYVFTNTHSYIDEDNNHLLCEIKLHRVKNATRHITRSCQYSLWGIDGVTVKVLKDIEFEEEYKIAKAEADQVEKERQEREAKAQAEYEEREKQYALESKKKAQEVLDYIKEHNLDIDEFTDIATKYYNHSNSFIELLRG